MPQITRRDFVGSVGAALTVASQAGTSGAAEPDGRCSPNILVICSDTHQADACGYRGHPLVETPNLDRLARQGTQFTNCYCGSPLCVPARAGLFSGMFPSDVDSWCNATVFQGQVPIWGTRLRESGYTCRATGKLDFSGLVDFGFDEVQTSHGHQRSPDITALFRRPLCYRVNERDLIDGHTTERVHPDERVLETATAFLEDDATQSNQPWTMFVGCRAPLPRFKVAKRYFDMYPVDQVPLPEIPPGYLEELPLPWQATRAYRRIATPIPEDRIRRARAAIHASPTASATPRAPAPARSSSERGLGSISTTPTTTTSFSTWITIQRRCTT